MVLAAADVELQSFRKLSGSIRVRCASTATITISSGLNAGDTIDGTTLVAGDLVLLKNQTASADNGVYVAGDVPIRLDWLSSRETSATTAYDRFPGLLVTVTIGTTNKNSVWQCESAPGGTLDTTAIVFKRLSEMHVADYGALGDNSTDDGAAINAALVALDANGGVLHFAAGKNYAISTQIVLTRLTNTTMAIIEGNGAYLEVSGAISGFKINGEGHGAGHTIINNLWMHFGPGNTTATYGWDIYQGRKIALYNCGLTGADNVPSAFAGILLACSTPSDDSTGTYWTTISKFQIGVSSGACCIRLRGDANATRILNCTFGGGAIGVESTVESGQTFTCDNIVIENCAFENMTTGIKIHAETGHAYGSGIVIANNRVESLTTFVLLDADTAPSAKNALRMYGNLTPGSGTYFSNSNNLIAYIEGWPVTAADNSLVRYESGGLNAQTSSILVSDTNDITGVVKLTTTGLVTVPKIGTTNFVSLADDAATSFTGNVGANARGVLIISGLNSTEAGVLFVRVGASPSCVILVAGANIAATTGVLGGTTGVDGKLTVSTHTDNLIYIENRTGGAMTIACTYIGQ